MSGDVEICESGLWVDAATGAVVDSAPETGRQLVPPGGALRRDRVAAVEAARAAAPVKVDELAPVAVEPDTDPGSVVDPVKAVAKKAAARKG